MLLVLIGALQLRQDDRLSEKSFTQLIGLTFKALPLFLRRNRSETPPTEP
jgi:hypothetical protein